MFSNQTVNQVRIDELIATQHTLTASELSDLAESLGFQNTQAMNNFGCDTQTDINIIKGSITSVANEDEGFVINSASKYYPDQTKFTGSGNSSQIRNLGIAIFTGNCSNIPIGPISNCDRDGTMACAAAFVNSLFNLIPGFDCGKLAINALSSNGYNSFGEFMQDLTGCGLGFIKATSPWIYLKLTYDFGSFGYCLYQNGCR